MLPLPTSVPPDCKGLHEMVARIGDKWTMMVIRVLAGGPLRFGELRRRVEGVSSRMLTLTVRALERDGVVVRRVYADVPPRVEYELTNLGTKLVEPLQALVHWARSNREEILRARREFDSRTQAVARSASDSGPKEKNVVITLCSTLATILLQTLLPFVVVF